MPSSSSTGPSWVKTSTPTVYEDKKTGKYRLVLNLTKAKGRRPKGRSQNISKHGTRQMLLLMDGGRTGNRAGKQPVLPLPATATSSASAQMPAPAVLPPGKSLNSVGKFGCVKEAIFKKRRREGMTQNRSEFNAITALPVQKLRRLGPGWQKRQQKAMAKFASRRHHLRRRTDALKADVAKLDEYMARLSANMTRNSVALLLPDGDASPDAEGAGTSERPQRQGPSATPTISLAQKERLDIQALTTLEMVREELGRDQLQLQCLEKARVLSSKEAPTTEAALKIAESKVFDLMNEAATVRKQFSLLEIAKNMVVSSHLNRVKPRTTLQWLHEFKELGGFFKRDARGVYERVPKR